jgi:hypothetical protein
MQPVELQRELARLARTARAARELLDELEHTVWVLRASMEADAKPIVEPIAGSAPNPTSSPTKQQVTAQAQAPAPSQHLTQEEESAPK